MMHLKETRQQLYTNGMATTDVFIQFYLCRYRFSMCRILLKDLCLLLPEVMELVMLQMAAPEGPVRRLLGMRRANQPQNVGT